MMLKTVWPKIRIKVSGIATTDQHGITSYELYVIKLSILYTLTDTAVYLYEIATCPMPSTLPFSTSDEIP